MLVGGARILAVCAFYISAFLGLLIDPRFVSGAALVRKSWVSLHAGREEKEKREKG